MSSPSKASAPRRVLAAITRRGNDIISMNRALAAAVERHHATGALAPGDLDRALREGRVSLIVQPSRPDAS